jgi:hypothetical protein
MVFHPTAQTKKASINPRESWPKTQDRQPKSATGRIASHAHAAVHGSHRHQAQLRLWWGPRCTVEQGAAISVPTTEADQILIAVITAITVHPVPRDKAASRSAERERFRCGHRTVGVDLGRPEPHSLARMRDLWLERGKFLRLETGAAVSTKIDYWRRRSSIMGSVLLQCRHGPFERGADQVFAGLALQPPHRICRSTALQVREATVRCALYGETADCSDLAVDQRVVEAVQIKIEFGATICRYSAARRIAHLIVQRLRAQLWLVAGAQVRETDVSQRVQRALLGYHEDSDISG